MTDHTSPTPARRTIRRYAHELYPHADDFERRPLETEVPYLYARAHGIDIYGTGYAMCFTDMDARREFQNRVMIMLHARAVALLADALYQGLAGELDAIIVKVRDGAHVRNKAAHIAVGVDMDGIKHVLGIWIQATEGAKFWAGVCAQLANRGVADVLIVCCDGLTGFPEAIEATWPQSTVQTCVVHLIRSAMRFVNYKSRKAVAAALKPIYQAADEDAALVALAEFAASELGKANPNTVRVFEDAWDRFTPFLAFPPMLRRVIYTTNSIESLNYQLRKIIKNRGHFPSDDAVVKLLWLAICNIEDKRARDRLKERGRPRGAKRNAEGRLVEGQITTNWKQALAQLALAYPDRIHPYL